MNPQPNHSVRRIVLPSGRSIEVVRFDQQAVDTQPLHICGQCSSPLVQPVDWCEVSNERWQLELSCPNCGWTVVDVYAEKQVHALEDKLDEGLADMLLDLQRLTQANMAEQIERFIAALATDQILPEDF